ncbi:hypothetical protein CLOM_g14065 [Closterium sp. NIES-68]|nr:hypothetical protein CLOM_g22183 [Closterium sp. NIES-68]GJP55080.1 hypothetical protein CLOM_g14065 [Closterium sp. NIES-68]GJP86224.1 hypothetical protein CLOP_g16274 [Closterium sp. NIES-67]
MVSVLTRVKYFLEKAAMYRFVFVASHLMQHPGTDPPIFQLVERIARVLIDRRLFVTSMKPTAAGGESLKPIIRGTKDEWVLCRYMLPPGLHDISVGDVVAMRFDPSKVTTRSDANPVNTEATTEAAAREEPPIGTAARPKPALSFKANNPKKARRRERAAQAKAAIPASGSANLEAAAAAAAAAGLDHEGSTPGEAESADKPLPIAFRRVAAVAGDEMVSSQPSDEPFRIEKDHFWLLADDPAVPAKEAIDSRTLGPVRLDYISGRALYVVRSAVDHEPIQNSPLAMRDDAAVMAMECNIEDLLKRIKSELIIKSQ